MGRAPPDSDSRQASPVSPNVLSERQRASKSLRTAIQTRSPPLAAVSCLGDHPAQPLPVLQPGLQVTRASRVSWAGAAGPKPIKQLKGSWLDSRELCWRMALGAGRPLECYQSPAVQELPPVAGAELLLMPWKLHFTYPCFLSISSEGLELRGDTYTWKKGPALSPQTCVSRGMWTKGTT